MDLYEIDNVPDGSGHLGLIDYTETPAGSFSKRKSAKSFTCTTCRESNNPAYHAFDRYEN